jgi:uncharacterized protein (DUF433 family)
MIRHAPLVLRWRHDVFGPAAVGHGIIFYAVERNIMQVQGYPHVFSDPAICGGVPCVADTRIPVRTIAAYHKMGATTEELAGKDYYPWLAPADVYGALLYYYDHQEEIDAEIEENAAFDSSGLLMHLA